MVSSFKVLLVLSEGIGNGNPLQYSCLENPLDRGAWWAAVHRVAQSHPFPPTYSSVPTIQFAQCAIFPNYLVKRDTGISLLTHDKYENLPLQ